LRYDAVMSQCSICQRPVAPRTENKAFPFCSPRCKTIDLGQWVDEKYRLPEDADAVAPGNGADQGEERAMAEALSQEKA
jgi:endogenous inhibitor of DNA gyrase (YacG/DUF329 family)